MGNLRKVPIYIFAFIFLGLISGYLTFKTLSFGRMVKVPALYGKSLMEADRLLAEKGLYLKIGGGDYDSTVPLGHILTQDVSAESKVEERKGIKVIISKGPGVQIAPTLLNRTLLDAEYMLLQKGLKITEVIRVHSDTVEKDKIVAQKPEPYERLNDHITVLVSLGPHGVIYCCPDFRGMSIEEAEELAGKLNLKIETEGYGSNVRVQRPVPETHVKKGETIYLQLE